jgi:hypothetical protein
MTFVSTRVVVALAGVPTAADPADPVAFEDALVVTVVHSPTVVGELSSPDPGDCACEMLRQDLSGSI